MLEERLSKAYSQHSLGGYNLPPPRQSVGPYPSLQSSAPNQPGPAENFYTGEAQPDYGRPQQYQPAHATPQPQFATYDKRASVSGPSHVQYPPQQIQRTESWRSVAAPGQAPQFSQQQNYAPAESAAPQVGPASAQQGRLAPQAPSEPLGTTPTTDPSASFYFNQPQAQAQQTPSAPPSEPMSSPYPTLRQAAPYQPSLPQTPAATPAQPSQPMQPQQQQQLPPQQPQAPYWAHPAAAHQAVPVPAQAPPQQVQPAPQAWPQAPNTAYDSYDQEAFPPAPHHAPKQPVVEEALIEL